MIKGSLRPGFKGGLVGLLLGLLVRFVLPAVYVARVTLYFPGGSVEGFNRLTDALAAKPKELQDFQYQLPGSGEFAVLLFGSQGAVGAAKDAGASIVSVENLGSGGVRCFVEARSTSAARQGLQAFWDYYESFVAEHPVSPTSRARRGLERELQKVASSLREQEVMLSRSRDARLHQLGDSAIRAKPEIMANIWRKRTEEENEGQALLDTLNTFRHRDKEQSRHSPEQSWTSLWSAGQKRLPGALPRFQVKTRKQDLLERIRLEREYYDKLLEFRSLLLQASFMRTLEALETSDYEILDPIRVEKKPRNWFYPLGFFVLGFASSGLVSSLMQRRG